MHFNRRVFLIVLAALAAIGAIAGCGSSSSTSSSTTTTVKVVAKGPAGAASATVTLSGNHETAKGTPAKLASVPNSALHGGGVQPHLAGLAGLSFVQKLELFGNDVANFWIQAFNAAKVKLPSVKMYIVGRTPGSCQTSPVTTNTEPIYCGPNDSIFLPLGYMSHVFAPIGDAAVLLEVSSLYGYHLEDAFGYFAAAQQGRLTSAQLRKLNLCLSGVYFSSVGRRNLLTKGDPQAVAMLIADKADAPGTPAGPGTVTAAQLTNAFLAGFKAASVQPCIPK